MVKIFNKIWLFVLIAITISLCSCSSKKEISPAVAQYYFDTYLITNNADGTIDVRSWGNGSDKSQAIERAKKDAVSDVIFKGFSGRLDPLTTEVNARERHEDYFDNFFSSKRGYLKYVKENSTRNSGSRVTTESDARNNYSVILTIDRRALKERLKSDGIIQ